MARIAVNGDPACSHEVVGGWPLPGPEILTNDDPWPIGRCRWCAALIADGIPDDAVEDIASLLRERYS